MSHLFRKGHLDVAAFGFTDDLAHFPRDEENIPDRLREKLVEEAEGRATE